MHVIRIIIFLSHAPRSFYSPFPHFPPHFLFFLSIYWVVNNITSSINMYLRRSICVEERELVSSSVLLAMEWDASSRSAVDRFGMNLSAPPPVFLVLYTSGTPSLGSRTILYIKRTWQRKWEKMSLNMPGQPLLWYHKDFIWFFIGVQNIEKEEINDNQKLYQVGLYEDCLIKGKQTKSLMYWFSQKCFGEGTN